MTTKFPIRHFADDAAIAGVGQRLLDRTLPRAEWTHEAHLVATLWLVRARPDIRLELELPAIIRTYNESVGGVNDDTQGYHETLTQFYIAEIRAHHQEMVDATLVESAAALLNGLRGDRNWPLQFYSHERLFSVEARRYYIPPDRQNGESPGTI